jgi:hypothetical protein
LVSHAEACGKTQYNLKVTRSPDYAIYVDYKSSCAPGMENGDKWATAYKTLQPAIDKALLEGKVIKVAEGIYKPTVRANGADPRSATFFIPGGVKIVGGFTGTETPADPGPDGSGYSTILSGDINGDDTNFTAWPPSSSSYQYLDDNAYHVITVNGNPNGTDISFENFVVQGGYADGTGTNAVGAGIYVKSGKPQFELVGVKNNFSISDGAGIYVPPEMGITMLRHCLFQNNVSAAGNGAGLCWLSADTLNVESSVFDANQTQASATDKGGGALYFKDAIVQLITCVFAGNSSNSILGALVNSGGTLYSINCTFAFNTGNGAVSICNSNDAYSTIKNCILWNLSGKNEVSGTNFIIEYSDITNGYSGMGNFASDPLFSNPSQASGANAKWGDYDDGLFLTSASPCRIKGNASGAPIKDMIENDWESFYSYIDIGALNYVNADPNRMLGKYDNTGSWYSTPSFTVLSNLKSDLGILLSLKKGYHRCIQVELPKRKETDMKNTIVVQVSTIRANNSTVGIPVNVILYRIGATQLFRSHYVGTGLVGKPLLFTSNAAMVGERAYAYVIQAEDSCKIKIRLDKRQFN